MTFVLLGALAAAILGAGSAVAWRVVRSFNPDWKPLGWGRAVYLAPTDVTPERVRACLDQAERALMQFAPQLNVGTMRVMPLAVEVRAEATWEDPAQQRVAGQTDIERDVVSVGRDCLALAHELGHLLERRATGKTSFEHLGWDTNGIRQAEAAYEAWVKTTQ